MKLTISLPLTLFIASTALACSSSAANPSTTPGDDASVVDSSSATPDSSSSSTPDSSSSTAPDSSSNTAPDAGPLSFSNDIYTPIIEHHCVGCHGPTADGGSGSGLAFGKLDMSSVDAGYANLVNAAAAGVDCADIDGGAGPVRVVPGSAATSLLYLKVNGFTTAPPCGSPMPKSGEIPDGGQAAVVQQIETWINGGALP